MARPAPLQAKTPVGTALRPLSKYSGSLAQRVHGSLRHAILNLHVQPGQALRKPEICTALGVSRSPVAEAVARLAIEGLVEVVPQSGTFVARFSMPEIREGAFLREALEVAAVARVAGSIDDAQVAQLRGIFSQQTALVGAGDIAGFYAEDAAMHEAILSFTGFRRAALLAETAWVHVNRARRLLLPEPGRVQATLDEHEAIVVALAARDGGRAVKATRHHLRQLLARLEPLAITRPELFADG